MERERDRGKRQENLVPIEGKDEQDQRIKALEVELQKVRTTIIVRDQQLEGTRVEAHVRERML